jgi:hypothetical protein
MDAEEAVALVRAHANQKYPHYASENLAVEEFESGWVIYPDSDPLDLDSLRLGQTIFLVGKDGRIMESSSSLPPGQAEAEFTRLYGGRA